MFQTIISLIHLIDLFKLARTQQIKLKSISKHISICFLDLSIEYISFIRFYAMDPKLEMKLVKTFRHTYRQINPSLESAIN